MAEDEKKRKDAQEEEKRRKEGMATRAYRIAGYDTREIRLLRKEDTEGEPTAGDIILTPIKGGGFRVESPAYAGENTAMVPRETTRGEKRADEEAPKETPKEEAVKEEPRDYCRLDCQGKGSFSGFCGSWPAGDYKFSCRGSRNDRGHTECRYK